MNLKKMILSSLIAVLAYATLFIIKIPISFLDFDIKDAILCLGGILIAGNYFLISIFITCLLEFLTMSSSGLFGLVMNLLASVFYIVPICFIYKKSLKSLLIGITIGTISMTIIMILLNLFFTPIFFGYAFKDVVALLIPLIIPFNIAKGAINGILILIILKPLKKALKLNL